MGLWFVEYSEKQKSFHMNEAEILVEQNRERFLINKDHSNDYVPLAICSSHEECHQTIEQLKQERRKL